jgi:hypothetical protein
MLKILFIKKKNMMKITKDIPGSQHEEIWWKDRLKANKQPYF